jgi:glutaredoxin 3
MYLIYGKNSCPYCVSAKELLETRGLDYEYLTLNVDFTREELLEKAPDAKTFPQIWHNSGDDIHHIGGASELKSYLVIQDVLDLLHTDVAEVTFRKVDGTERTMICTRNSEIIREETGDLPTTQTSRKKSEETISVYDLENNGWRSFRKDSLITFGVHNNV